VIKYREDKREKKAQCVKTTSYNCGLSCINVKKNCRIVPNDSRSKDRLEKLKAIGIDYATAINRRATKGETIKPDPIIPPGVDSLKLINDFTPDTPSIAKQKPINKPETPEQRKARLLEEAKEVRGRLDKMSGDFISKFDPSKHKGSAIIKAIDDGKPEKYLAKLIEGTKKEIDKLSKTNPPLADILSENKLRELEAASEDFKRFSSEARKLVQVDLPTNLNVEIKDKKNKSRWDEGIQSLSLMVSIPGLMSKVKVKGLPEEDKRSYYNNTDKTVSMGNDDPGTVIHELSHWIEYSVPEIKKEVVEFYNRRTKGEKVVKMRDATGIKSYRDTEITKVDKWMRPYMGKVYPDESTEILSMGLELMYRNPVALAKQDPDMFDFIYSVVRRG
jgi:hypothetical protein